MLREWESYLIYVNEKLLCYIEWEFALNINVLFEYSIFIIKRDLQIELNKEKQRKQSKYKTIKI